MQHATCEDNFWILNSNKNFSAALVLLSCPSRRPLTLTRQVKEIDFIHSKQQILLWNVLNIKKLKGNCQSIQYKKDENLKYRTSITCLLCQQAATNVTIKFVPSKHIMQLNLYTKFIAFNELYTYI